MNQRSVAKNTVEDEKIQTPLDAILGGGTLMLDIIQQVADLSNIQFVSQAASLLLKLLEIIQVEILPHHSHKYTKAHSHLAGSER